MLVAVHGGALDGRGTRGEFSRAATAVKQHVERRYSHPCGSRRERRADRRGRGGSRVAFWPKPSADTVTIGMLNIHNAERPPTWRTDPDSPAFLDAASTTICVPISQIDTYSERQERDHSRSGLNSRCARKWNVTAELPELRTYALWVITVSVYIITSQSRRIILGIPYQTH